MAEPGRRDWVSFWSERGLKELVVVVAAFKESDQGSGWFRNRSDLKVRAGKGVKLRVADE